MLYNIVYNLFSLFNILYLLQNNHYFQPDDSNLILGNYQGDLVIRGVFSDNDQVMESVCQGPIVAVKPARDGNRVLVIEEGVWNNSCFLYSLQSTSIK